MTADSVTPICPPDDGLIEHGEGEPTAAESRAALDQCIQADAFARPTNRLVHKNPGDTVVACRRVLDWLAHVEEPFHSEELDAAKADVLHLVVDALEHAERLIEPYWRKEALS